VGLEPLGKRDLDHTIKSVKGFYFFATFLILFRRAASPYINNYTRFQADCKSDAERLALGARRIKPRAHAHQLFCYTTLARLGRRSRVACARCWAD